MRASRPNLAESIAFAIFLSAIAFAKGQSTTTDALNHVTRSATFEFVEQGGTCVWGTIAAADASTITVDRQPNGPVTIRRNNLLQVSQNGALLFSARSSWADVISAPVNSQEALVLKLKKGEQITGKPVQVTADGIRLKHALATTFYPKVNVESVVYLRVKPETDKFDYFLQEAPFLVFFTPEFYSRAMHLEGRIPVSLYDASKPEDDTQLKCLKR